MTELAPGVHSLGHGKGGHVHAFLIDDGNELTLVGALFEDDDRLVLEEIDRLGRRPSDDFNKAQLGTSLRRMAALDAHIVGVGHGDPTTTTAPSSTRVAAHPTSAAGAHYRAGRTRRARPAFRRGRTSTFTTSAAGRSSTLPSRTSTSAARPWSSDDVKQIDGDERPAP